MIKSISILISLLILFQSFNINLDVIMHVDELIEHAKYHAEEYGDNLFVFVSKHYGELKEKHDKNHNEEKQDHEQLPFNHNCFVNIISVFILDQEEFSIEKIDIIDSTTIFGYQETYSLFEKKSIFQPPKLT